MKDDSCPQCLNSNLHTLHRNLREQREEKKSSGAIYQSVYVQTRRCLLLGDEFTFPYHGLMLLPLCQHIGRPARTANFVSVYVLKMI